MSDLGHTQNPASNSDISLCPNLNETKTLNEAIYRVGNGATLQLFIEQLLCARCCISHHLAGRCGEMPADTPRHTAALLEHRPPDMPSGQFSRSDLQPAGAGMVGLRHN